MKRVLYLFIIATVLTGCTSGSPKKPLSAPAVPEAGFFKSQNRGDSWAQKGDVYSLKKEDKKLTYTAINSITLDPLDSNTIYLGTNAGLYYSYNRGEGWNLTYPDQGSVNTIAIDPGSSCIIYAAVFNKLAKTDNCGRTWRRLLTSSLPNEFYTAMLVNPNDRTIIYVGSSRGYLYESSDSGATWRLKSTYGPSIDRLFYHPNVQGVWYMVNPTRGIMRTDDDGVTFTELRKLPVRKPDGEPMMNGTNPLTLEDPSLAGPIYDIKNDLTQNEGMIIATGYGLFRLIGNEYWQEVATLSKPRDQLIAAVGIDARDGNSLYFATSGFLYRSSDGGANWSNMQLPSSGIIRWLSVAQESPDELYSFYVPRPKK